MINVASLTAIVVLLVVQTMTKKLCVGRGMSGAVSFSLGSVFFALTVFLCPVLFGFDFAAPTLGYSLGFAVCYSAAVVFGILAIQEGPLSVTALISSMSLIIPTFYGLFALGEPRSVWLYMGICCLCASLVLINIERKGEKKKLTLRWGIYTLLAFVGNGACSTVQKVQIVNQGGAYKNEFMVMALAMSLVVILIFALVREGKAVASNLRKGFFYFALCGLANGAANFLVIFLSGGRVASSVLFPVVSAGSTVLTVVISLVWFRERLSRVQWVAVAMGVVSIVLLNL